jgi:hypothetical protein
MRYWLPTSNRLSILPQLLAFNRAVPEKVMVFSLAGSLQLPGIPTIPAIEYSMDAMAARIVSWLTEKTRCSAAACCAVI